MYSFCQISMPGVAAVALQCTFLVSDSTAPFSSIHGETEALATQMEVLSFHCMAYVHLQTATQWAAEPSSQLQAAVCVNCGGSGALLAAVCLDSATARLCHSGLPYHPGDISTPGGTVTGHSPDMQHLLPVSCRLPSIELVMRHCVSSKIQRIMARLRVKLLVPGQALFQHLRQPLFWGTGSNFAQRTKNQKEEKPKNGFLIQVDYFKFYWDCTQSEMAQFRSSNHA